MKREKKKRKKKHNNQPNKQNNLIDYSLTSTIFMTRTSLQKIIIVYKACEWDNTVNGQLNCHTTNPDII